MAEFLPAVEVVLKHEGGYVNDPKDKGGETQFGISKRAYPSVDIKALTVEDAKKIYERDYWRFAPINDQLVANKLLDLAVWMGPKTANRLLQLATCACGHLVICDGRLGAITISAANAIPPDELLTTLKQEAVERIQHLVALDPSQDRFYDGWCARARA